MKPSVPFSKVKAEEMLLQYGSPLYVYDVEAVKAQVNNLRTAFSWGKDYTNFFAVKAAPFGPLLDVIHGAGMGFDCANSTELEMVLKRGLTDNGIYFTYAGARESELRAAMAAGAIINLGKAAYVDRLLSVTSDPASVSVSLRYNPGALQDGDAKIGRPEDSQFGDTAEALVEGYKKLQAAGVNKFSLHTMVGSNMLSPKYFERTAELLKNMLETLAENGINIAIVNIGGGLGVAYKEHEQPPDLHDISAVVKAKLGGLNVRVVSENGRYVTGSCGYLLTTVNHKIVHTYSNFLPTDVSVNNAARLASVGDAHHDVVALGEHTDDTTVVDLVGEQCSGSDRFLKNVSVPSDITEGDILVIKDAGAHMASNRTTYNFNPQAEGALLFKNGSHTLAHSGLKKDQILELAGMNLPKVK